MKQIPIELIIFLSAIALVMAAAYVTYSRPVITEAHTVSEVRYLANACTGDVSIETVYDNYIPVLWRVRCVTPSP